MPNSMSQDLLEMQQSLLGFSSTVSNVMKEQLESILKIYLELNAQINYLNALRAMLHAEAKMSPAVMNKRLSTLTALNSELTYQNEVLTKLQKQLPATLLLDNGAVPESQKQEAKKMFKVMEDKLRTTQEENNKLSKEAKNLRDKTQQNTNDVPSTFKPPRQG